MRQLLFFAVKEDLISLFQIAESKGSLKYVRMGNFEGHEVKGDLPIFDAGASIPNLGIASADSSAACDAYLVCARETPISLRVLQGGNGKRVCIDQLANPDTVEFKPGGLWHEDVLLYGRIATASETQASQALMKRFQAALRKAFAKVKVYSVGPKARTLFESGKRLTISAQSPREFDLTIDSVSG